MCEYLTWEQASFQKRAANYLLQKMTRLKVFDPKLIKKIFKYDEEQHLAWLLLLF